jgi:hypothetical protein
MVIFSSNKLVTSYYTLGWRKLAFMFVITWPCYASKLVAIVPATLETQEWREDPQGGKHKALILHKHANAVMISPA